MPTLPDSSGYFGVYGGKFIPETLVNAVEDLEGNYLAVRSDRSFQEEYRSYLRDYAGRPTPLYLARRMTQAYGGARIYLKREDLCHTGAHKINNTLGQALLARRMNKKRIIAETGAGQHGVAVAAVSALFGIPCAVYMGEADMARQAPNVARMQLLGAEVRPVGSGSRTLKEAISEAIRDWISNVETTFYIIGSVVGMHPYPMMVRDFQSVIGQETKQQILEKEGRLPDCIVACVGGGSNAIGMFSAFLQDVPGVKLVGVEAGGRGMEPGQHAASLAKGRPGVLHGAYEYVLQSSEGQIEVTHSISAGLDYPGVGPEHGYLKDAGLAEYTSVTDEEALDAFEEMSRLEGILPALEPAHAVAYTKKLAPALPKEGLIVVSLSGRGDKDLETVLKVRPR